MCSISIVPECACVRLCFNKSLVITLWPESGGILVATTENCKMIMATQSSLESLNPSAESIEDYKERFDFYCTAHQIPEARRKALFLTRCFHQVENLGQSDPVKRCITAQHCDHNDATLQEGYSRDSITIQVLQADPTGERVSCRLHSRT